MTIDDELLFIDSHCHLDMPPLCDNLEQVLLQAEQTGVNHMVTIGIDRHSSEQAVALARRYPQISAAVGIHPHDAAKASPADLEAIGVLAASEEVVAYGEIGLDYAKKYAPVERQQQLLNRQLEMARDLELPIIIHDRDAHDDILHALQRLAPFPCSGIMHCFSGDVQLARKVLDLNLLISIPGIVTFKKAAQLREVVQAVPLDRLLLETDAPFLAPVPHRGKPNQPAYLVHTARKVAELKQVSLKHVARQTRSNLINLLKIG